jgi:hypothetical protein
MKEGETSKNSTKGKWEGEYLENRTGHGAKKRLNKQRRWGTGIEAYGGRR